MKFCVGSAYIIVLLMRNNGELGKRSLDDNSYCTFNGMVFRTRSVSISVDMEF